MEKLVDLRSFREPDEQPSLPKDIDALRLLQMVYRGEAKESPQQMRAAIEALPYEQPKLSAVGIGYLDANDFASRLDRAVERSERARLIEEPRNLGLGSQICIVLGTSALQNNDFARL